MKDSAQKYDGKPATKRFFNSELKKGSLFLHEKYLGGLPDDWIDCVMFIAIQGMDQCNHVHLITLEEKEFLRINKLISKKEIKLFIVSNDKKKIWNLVMMKEKPENEYKRVFVGGENLRQFCDERNIFYKSHLTEDNLLLSGTTMLWQKEPNEDCRKPVNSDIN